MASGNDQSHGEEGLFWIELSLLDLSEVVKNDASGEELPTLATTVLDSLSCYTAETYLVTPPASIPHRTRWGRRTSQQRKIENEGHDVMERLQKQVTRFLQVKDKYISLSSILLKSQAFHKTHSLSSPSCSEEQQQMSTRMPLPVIEIPRTQYKKPFIPSRSKHDALPEMNLYPLSISHQFPFVGMARLVIDAKESSTEDPSIRPLVGLDIVTFEDYNPRLYGSTSEFLNVFQASFTTWEWNCINLAKSTGHMLQEFYLRWAIKEAYTKALGVGMGFSFDSFETRLHDIADDDGIFAWLSHQNSVQSAGESQNNSDDDVDKIFMLPGAVVTKPSTSESKSEECTFYFLPLWDEDDSDAAPSSIDKARGCACICLVHAPEKQKGGNFHLTTNWLSLDGIVSWHANRR